MMKWTDLYHMRFEVLMAMAMKIAIFWDVTV